MQEGEGQFCQTLVGLLLEGDVIIVCYGAYLDDGGSELGRLMGEGHGSVVWFDC